FLDFSRLLKLLVIRPTQDRADASEKFAYGKRFDDVIVGSGFKALDAAVLLILRGQHQDRSEAAVPTNLLTNFVPAQFRHHEIEDDKVRTILANHAITVEAVD